jgi:hypothetical protein
MAISAKDLIAFNGLESEVETAEETGVDHNFWFV